MNSNTALEAYLGFLDSSSTTDRDQPLCTPRIDSVLHHYRQRDSSDTPSDHPQPVREYESRLKQLEGQLASLLQRSKDHTALRVHGVSEQTNKRTYHSTDSDSDTPIPRPATTRHPSGTKPTNVHTTSKSASQRKSRTQSASKPSNSHTTSRRRRDSIPGNKGTLPHHSISEDRKKQSQLLIESQREGGTSQAVVQELESERERRWKAEQAAGRLVEHVQSLQSQLGEAKRKHELVVARAAHLEGELEGEREKGQRLQTQIQQLQNDISSCRGELMDVRVCVEEKEKALRGLEEASTRLETERIQERTHLTQLLRECEQTASGHSREVDLLRRSVRQLKHQLHQTQELLANREREHLKELERCKPLDSGELAGLVEREVGKERARMEAVVEQHAQRLSEQQKAYKSLEDEFRMALRIEAGRYQELQRSYDEVFGEVDACRQTAVAAVQKEQRATHMVAELTAMVKEQKGRLSELVRSKHEASEQWQEKASQLEREVVARNKQEVRVQSLQEENLRLSARVTAQESVIEGLREERKLWGKELAYQGASLAQDRGRMESQVEALTQDLKAVREQSQNDKDTLRIKEKLLEDQAETIRHLKQTVAARDHEIQSHDLDWQNEQQSLQLQLEQEESTNQDLQDQLSVLVERKDQLKEDLAAALEETNQWKSRFSKLRSQWDERVGAIGSLEENMTQLQRHFSEKETKLTAEREQAEQRARSAEERLRSCDDAFREQLEAKQRSHDSQVTKLLQEKNVEIEKANERVVCVESEMRELLTEMAREKRNTEEKIQRLSRAFHDWQQDIT